MKFGIIFALLFSCLPALALKTVKLDVDFAVSVCEKASNGVWCHSKQLRPQPVEISLKVEPGDNVPTGTYYTTELTGKLSFSLGLRIRKINLDGADRYILYLNVLGLENEDMFYNSFIGQVSVDSLSNLNEMRLYAAKHIEGASSYHPYVLLRASKE